MKRLIWLFMGLILLNLPTSAEMYYQYTNDLDGAIEREAGRYNVDFYILKALVYTLMNDRAELSGYYDMQMSSYPGMSAESLASNLARVMAMCERHQKVKEQEAIAKGEQFNEVPYYCIIKEITPPQKPKTGLVGKDYFFHEIDKIIKEIEASKR